VTVAEQQPALTASRSTIAWHQRKSVRSAVGKVIAMIILIGLGILFVAPVLWMFSSSVKDNLHVLDGQWIPSTWHWSNFKQAWSLNGADFNQYARNTLVIMISSVVGVTLSSSLVAYSFARLRWPVRDMVFILVLAAMLLPGIVLFLPQFIIWSKLGFVDTYIPLVLPAWFGAPSYIFLLRQFFLGIPQDYDDAAEIDGFIPVYAEPPADDMALALGAQRSFTAGPGLTPGAGSVGALRTARLAIEAGRAGKFGFVVGVDRVGHADALRAHGADIVVKDLGELL